MTEAEAKELKDRLNYFYRQTDGSMRWPNSAEGDLLKMAHRVLPELAKIRPLQVELERAKEDRNKAALQERQKYLPLVATANARFQKARAAMKALLVTYGPQLQGNWYERSALDSGLKLNGLGFVREDDSTPTDAEADKLWPRQHSGHRFEYRMFDGDKWQVYGDGLKHVAACETEEQAQLVTSAMNAAFP